MVVAHPFLEEVGFARERDALHEVERVAHVVVFRIAEGEEETVGDEFDVLLHQSGVHAQQGARQRFRQEFLLDLDGFGDDVLHRLLRRPVVQVGEEQAGEVGVQALVARDELVAEGETRHQAAFLQPEDRRERTAEEYPLDCRESDKPLCERGRLVFDPFDRPIGLFANAGD